MHWWNPLSFYTFWSVRLQVRDQLLLLSKHGLQGVELGLELLYGDLVAALRHRGVLGGHPAGGGGGGASFNGSK